MNDETLVFEFHCEASDERLDRFLSERLSISRTRIVQLIEGGCVLVNKNQKNKNYRLSAGDEIVVEMPDDEEIDALPEDIPLDIVYEDKDIIVVNKPQNMVVHPAPGNPNGTLVNALLYHCKDSLSGINGKLRPGIVHRIDKDTSGLLIVAKNDPAHNALSEMFKDHSFTRQYHAIVYGSPKDDEGFVSLAIGRSKKDRKKMMFYPSGTPNTKEAKTHYRVLQRFEHYAYLELTLETGRTHQIRVHMLSLGCPVVGDPLYAPGRKNFNLIGQCLHAKNIVFSHPITGEKMFFDSPLPPYFLETLEKIKNC